MAGSEFKFRADDGVALIGRRWLPEGRPRAVVQIAHGLAEHSARYARLAGALNAAGYAVYSNDLAAMGRARLPPISAISPMRTAGRKPSATSGRSIASSRRSSPAFRLFFSAIRPARGLASSSFPNIQDALAGVAYSGSNGKPPPIAAAGRLIARAERLRQSKRGKSRLVNSLMFDGLNKPFAPARTKSDWLSRDPAEVDAYVADPLCGFDVTTQLAIDLLDALPGLIKPERLARIRKDLPIYVFSGERDPVGPISKA